MRELLAHPRRYRGRYLTLPWEVRWELRGLIEEAAQRHGVHRRGVVWFGREMWGGWRSVQPWQKFCRCGQERSRGRFWCLCDAERRYREQFRGGVGLSLVPWSPALLPRPLQRAAVYVLTPYSPIRWCPGLLRPQEPLPDGPAELADILGPYVEAVRRYILPVARAHSLGLVYRHHLRCRKPVPLAPLVAKTFGRSLELPRTPPVPKGWSPFVLAPHSVPDCWLLIWALRRDLEDLEAGREPGRLWVDDEVDIELDPHRDPLLVSYLRRGLVICLHPDRYAYADWPPVLEALGLRPLSLEEVATPWREGKLAELADLVADFWRQSRHPRVEELAELAGVHRDTIRRWEGELARLTGGEWAGRGRGGRRLRPKLP